MEFIQLIFYNYSILANTQIINKFYYQVMWLYSIQAIKYYIHSNEMQYEKFEINKGIIRSHKSKDSDNTIGREKWGKKPQTIVHKTLNKTSKRTWLSISMVICNSNIQSGSISHDGGRKTFEVTTSTLPL